MNTRQIDARACANHRALTGLCATLLCILATWAGRAAPADLLDIASAPVFLLYGSAPNLILTIDDSSSMNQASLPEGIWGPDGGTGPQLDARDLSSLTNRQYYDPAQTYLPPLNADGTSRDHAVFTKSLVDAFHDQTGCTLDLSKRYAATWSLGKTGDGACDDLSAATVAAMNNYNSYAADVGHPQYEEFLKTATPNSTPIQLGWEWAWRCMVGSPGNSGNAGNAGNANSSNNASICKAVYYRLDNSKSECKNLNPETIKAVDFPIDCLERVVVGTGPDFGEIRNRKNDDVTRTVLAEREDQLKNRDGTVPNATALAERNFANWFSYYRTRFLTLKTVLSRVFNDLPPTVRFGYQNLQLEGSYLPGDAGFISLADTFAPYADNRKTFFDWLFDSRAKSRTYLVSAAARVHELCATPQVYVEQPMSEGGELIQSEDVIVNPLRGCRNNFHVIFTDGFWEDTIWVPSARGSAFTGLKPPKTENDPYLWLGNNDATKKDLPPDSASVAASGLKSETYDPNQDYAKIFADQNIGMLADVVFASWITDLRPDEPAAEHRVPPLIRVPKGSTDRPEDYFWNPANDPADWQHITTYTIGLGVAGNVSYPEGTWTSDDSPCGKPDDPECKNISIDGFPGAWNAIGGTATSPNANLVPATTKIDDTWHAGINGRGGYLSAGNTAALSAAFSNVLNAVSTLANDSSAASATVNTGTTASQSVVYQARLNATRWSGDIRSFQVSAGKGKEPCPDLNILPGQLCQDPSAGQFYRSAALAMRGIEPNDRRIFTAAAGTGTVFSWESLTATQRLDFLRGAGYTGTDPENATDPQQAEAQARMAYVRGDRTYEEDGQVYRFRTRALISPCAEPPGCTNLLGDFINAAPVLVGSPAFNYYAPGYQSAVGTNTPSFKEQYRTRTPLVYAGANDGMLHAFYADTLNEAFAFVPPVLMGLTGVTDTQVQRPGLHVLSHMAYGGNTQKHRNFVDGPMETGDVRFGITAEGDWHTVLIGALGLGAQGLYALDVTDVPSASATVNSLAESLYHWQFTDRDDPTTDALDGDPDLGYVFGRPSIVRVRGALVGRSESIWVALVGNGYNSSENDGSRAAGCDDPELDEGATACGQAVLYVIEIETGRVIKKFSTGIGRQLDPVYPAEADADKRRANALGQPAVVTDSIEDGDIIADFAYAADLFGNLYRFDLTKDTSTKPIRKLFAAVGPTVGSTVGSAQPITAALAVARHPLGKGMLVLFGTGKYLETADTGDRQIQSFYAIWDTGSAAQQVVSRTALLRQEFLETNIATNAGEGASAEEITSGRTSTKNEIDWSTHQGWYIDFDIEKESDSSINKGERVVTEPEIRRGRVLFASLVPETNPCAGGGYSWLNALDLRNGGRFGVAPFDFNFDGAIDEADLLPTTGGEKVVGSSIRLTPGGNSTGIYSAPSSFCVGTGCFTVLSDSQAKLHVIGLTNDGLTPSRVWQQLR